MVDATSGEDGNGEEESEDMDEKQVVEEEHVKPIKAEDADAEDADFRFAIARLRDASPSKSPIRTDRMAPQPHDSVAPSLSRPYGTSNGFVPHVWSSNVAPSHYGESEQSSGWIRKFENTAAAALDTFGVMMFDV